MDLNSIIRRVEVGFYGNEHDDFAKVRDAHQPHYHHHHIFSGPSPDTSELSLHRMFAKFGQIVNFITRKRVQSTQAPNGLSFLFSLSPRSLSLPSLRHHDRLSEYFEILYAKFLKSIESNAHSDTPSSPLPMAPPDSMILPPSLEE